MNKKIRLAGIAYESLVNGPGLRRVFFSQGCKHNCEECFNPETHDFNSGAEMDMDELIQDVINNPMLKGVTFSGGDPFERAEEFAYMAKIFKSFNINIWCYSGYTFEYIMDNVQHRRGWGELISLIDVLVDGKFQVSKKDDGLMYRGSSNQRLVDVQKSINSNRVIEIISYR